MEMIRCEDLMKTYGSGTGAVHAVDGVSLSFEQGSFTAVTGKSGSGKSTLLHLLSGLDRPTSGKVIYQDNNLFQYNDNQLSVLRRRRFGFVFQAYNLVRELTAQENILLPVMLDNRKPDEAYLKRLVEMLKDRKPLSLNVVTLLDKPDRRVVEMKADLSLFTIPDKFVIGYGLDCAEYYRNLPYIGEYGEG